MLPMAVYTYPSHHGPGYASLDSGRNFRYMSERGLASHVAYDKESTSAESKSRERLSNGVGS